MAPSFVAAALAVSLLAVSDADSGTAEEAIRAAYATFQVALLKNDASAVATFLATNFQARQVDGSVQDRKAHIGDQVAATPGLTTSSRWRPAQTKCLDDTLMLPDVSVVCAPIDLPKHVVHECLKRDGLTSGL